MHTHLDATHEWHCCLPAILCLINGGAPFGGSKWIIGGSGGLGCWWWCYSDIFQMWWTSWYAVNVWPARVAWASSCAPQYFFHESEMQFMGFSMDGRWRLLRDLYRTGPSYYKPCLIKRLIDGIGWWKESKITAHIRTSQGERVVPTVTPPSTAQPRSTAK